MRFLLIPKSTKFGETVQKIGLGSFKGALFDSFEFRYHEVVIIMSLTIDIFLIIILKIFAIIYYRLDMLEGNIKNTPSFDNHDLFYSQLF